MRRTPAGLFALILAGLAVLGAAGPASGEFRYLGTGRIFSNDTLGDLHGHDRWRTGGYQVSPVFGPEWNGYLPQTPGEILELRLRSEIVAPSNLADPDPDDRLYAAWLSAGVHAHWQALGAELAAGADIVAIGPQTGLRRLHGKVHEAVGMAAPNVDGRELGDDVRLAVTVEAGRSLRYGGIRVRPFVEGQAGLETLLRFGADLTVGGLGESDLMMRDPTTGQRVQAVAGRNGLGASYTLGLDYALVSESALLPEDLGPAPREGRARLRGGMHFQGRRHAVFAGVTYLGPEFEGQPEGQTLGTLQIRLDF